MKIKYIQVNCVEGNKADFRQAEAIVQYQPDIVLLEYPNDNKTPDTEYNKFPLDKKPTDLLEKQLESLRRHLVEMPYVESDIRMWVNISNQWEKGNNIQVYRTDAPHKLVNEFYEVWKNMYPCAEKNWLWWVQIYLREKYMAKNIKWALNNQSQQKKNIELIVLVFLQSFHWKHVKFLLKNPPKDKIWNYYFGKFSEISQSSIMDKIIKNNKVFAKYWKTISDFDRV